MKTLKKAPKFAVTCVLPNGKPYLTSTHQLRWVAPRLRYWLRHKPAATVVVRALEP